MLTFSIIIILLGWAIVIGARIFRNAAYFKSRKDPEAWRSARPKSRKLIYLGFAIVIIGVLMLLSAR